MRKHQLIFWNRATGRVLRIEHAFTGLPREAIQRAARERNEREGRANRNSAWGVRELDENQ
jgi:hypothetical protein